MMTGNNFSDKLPGSAEIKFSLRVWKNRSYKLRAGTIPISTALISFITGVVLYYILKESRLILYFSAGSAALLLIFLPYRKAGKQDCYFKINRKENWMMFCKHGVWSDKEIDVSSIKDIVVRKSDKKTQYPSYSKPNMQQSFRDKEWILMLHRANSAVIAPFVDCSFVGKNEALKAVENIKKIIRF